MIQKLKDQLDTMEGQEIKPGGPIVHNPVEASLGWYIAYSTST
jgi:hypothetical protein